MCMMTKNFNETSMIAIGGSSHSIAGSHITQQCLNLDKFEYDLSRVHEVGVAASQQAGLTKFQ